jgi:hypothetical protein
MRTHISHMPAVRRMHHRPIHPAWLEPDQGSGAFERPSSRRPSLEMVDEEDFEEANGALVKRERRLGTLLGATGGAVGGALMLMVARAWLVAENAAFDPAVRFGEKVVRFMPGAPPEMLGLVLAVLIGAVTGAFLGRFTWRVRRVVPRTLFFAILAPTAWIFVHVFFLGHMNREQIAAVPAAPFLVGALLYGLMVAAVPITRRARVSEILPEKH